MAKLVGHVLAVVGDPSAIDGPTSVATSNGLGQRNPVGVQSYDDAGNLYIYVAGVASVAQGDWVFYSQANVLAMVRVLNDANTGKAGQVGVAQAAVVASCWGWVLIYGQSQSASFGTANVLTAATVDAALYRSGTTARLSNSAVAKDTVFGAYSSTAGSGNLAAVTVNYPFVVDQSTL